MPTDPNHFPKKEICGSSRMHNKKMRTEQVAK